MYDLIDISLFFLKGFVLFILFILFLEMISLFIKTLLYLKLELEKKRKELYDELNSISKSTEENFFYIIYILYILNILYLCYFNEPSRN